MTAPTAPLAGQRVLLVEDDYLTAMDLTCELKDRGAQVIGPAASVGQALRLIENTDLIDSAVLDINLRGEMVFPVVDVLVKQGVPFLFLTGYDRTVIPKHYTDAAYYIKPVNPAEIMGSLARTDCTKD